MAYYEMGLAYAHKQDYDRAIECYARATEVESEDFQLKSDFANIYYNMALAYTHKQNHDKAMKCYDKIIERYAKEVEWHPYPYAYHCIGLAYVGKKNYDKAVECYDKEIKLFVKVIESELDHASAHYNIGEAYKQKGDEGRAQEYKDKAKRLGYKFGRSF